MKNKDLFSLKNKVAIITGAGGLLGAKHAEVIAAYGGHLALLDIRLDKIKSLAKRVSQEYGIQARPYKVDITQNANVRKISSTIEKQFGRIDILINNAASNPTMKEIKGKGAVSNRLENFSLSGWNHDINVGLTGSFLCSKFFGAKMMKRGGSIINISSDLGLIGPDQRIYEIKGVKSNLQSTKPISYSVVKTGLIGMTRYLATYWAAYNIRCNAICPGGVYNNQNQQLVSQLRSRIPLNRMARVDEYQGIILFLASEASSYMTGSVLPIDGGRTAW